MSNSTGGIIWETSYLLLSYLLSLPPLLTQPSTTRHLDVGSGCGLIPLALNRTYNWPSVGSEIGGEVLDLLTSNVSLNLRSNNPDNNVKVQQLDWTKFEKIEEGGEYDLVTGTDVIFRVDLVVPLLNVLSGMTKPITGMCYLCCQKRCPDSHEFFLEKLNEGGWFDSWEDVSEEVWGVVEWGRGVEGK